MKYECAVIPVAADGALLPVLTESVCWAPSPPFDPFATSSSALEEDKEDEDEEGAEGGRRGTGGAFTMPLLMRNSTALSHSSLNFFSLATRRSLLSL